MPKYTVDISDKVVKDLDKFAKRYNISRAEAARRAFALLALAEAEADKGNSIGIIKKSNNSDDENKFEVVAKVKGV